jgi:hypothetical protein
MAEMFMEKMHAFGNLLQDEWQVFTTPETHLPIHAVINYFPNQQIHENFLTIVTICA